MLSGDVLDWSRNCSHQNFCKIQEVGRRVSSSQILYHWCIAYPSLLQGSRTCPAPLRVASPRQICRRQLDLPQRQPRRCSEVSLSSLLFKNYLRVFVKPLRCPIKEAVQKGVSLVIVRIRWWFLDWILESQGFAAYASNLDLDTFWIWEHTLHVCSCQTCNSYPQHRRHRHRDRLLTVLYLIDGKAKSGKTSTLTDDSILGYCITGVGRPAK